MAHGSDASLLRRGALLERGVYPVDELATRHSVDVTEDDVRRTGGRD